MESLYPRQNKKPLWIGHSQGDAQRSGGGMERRINSDRCSPATYCEEHQASANNIVGGFAFVNVADLNTLDASTSI